MTYKTIAVNFFQLLACAVFACSNALAVTPASSASLEQLFELLQVQKTNQDLLDALEAQHAQQIDQAPDSASKSRKRTEHEKVAAFLREKLSWGNMRPMAVNAYQASLTESDLASLLAHYETRVGQLELAKFRPANMRVFKSLMQHIDERVDAIIDNADSKRPTTPRGLKQWSPTNKHERVAAELATLLMKDRFNARLREMETKMVENMMLVLPEAQRAEAVAEAKRYAALIRRDITFNSVLPVITKEFTADLSETEMGELLQSERSPARKQQRMLLQKAEDRLRIDLEQWVKTHLFPELMALIMPSSEASAPD